MNDKAIRKILISFLKVRFPEIRIFQEKSIGNSICDLMAVTDCLMGFEIKSDLDNYERINRQVNAYKAFFNMNYLVVGKSHEQSARKKVPDDWGIIVIKEDGVTVARSPHPNASVDLRKQISILWKLEMKNLLNYFRLPMFALKSKEYIADMLVEKVPKEQLSKQIAYELMHRDYSVYDAKDYTEYYQNEAESFAGYQRFDLLDNVSEMDLNQMTLDQWIEIYRKAKQINQIKEKKQGKIERPPHEISYKDIEVSPGVPWISERIIEQFVYYLVYETDDENRGYYFPVHYEPITGNWFIESKNSASHYVTCSVKYGLEKYNALHILEATLNLRTIKLYDSGKKYDEAATLAAIEKQKLILELFSTWIWQDEDRKWEVEEAYNKLFAGYKKERFDGSNLEFPEMKSSFELYDYQKDAIQRIISTDNTLLAFDVGAGKTFIMITAAMLMRQQGLSRKNMFVVPNNIVGQWEKIFTDLYPNARLLVVEPKSFKKPVRGKTLELIKYGDYDGIIIAYSCFDMIPLSSEYITAQMDLKIEEINEAIRKVRMHSGSPRALELEKQNIIKLSKELVESMDYTTPDVTFEELEINTIFLDEAHNYKNLPLRTKMKNVRGINTSGSKKCYNLLQKVRCVQNMNDGRGVVFATGTPLCNSISDAYAMQMYLQHDDMERSRLEVFDNWIKTFARPEQIAEIDVDTQHYRMVTRFATFFNLPELSRMFSKIAIFHAMEQEEGIPAMESYSDCVVKQNRDLQNYMLTLSDRSEKIRGGQVDRKKDNMLKVSTDGRKAALDLRLVGLEQPPESSKICSCVKKVAEIYSEHEGCSQLIFCDYSTPKSDRFNVYTDIKEQLVKMGIPKEEIAFIHSYHTEERKVELYSKVNEGSVRVLIGSTFKLGIGANVQTKLKAIHHLDVPWRPADVGRILRTFKIKKNVEVTDNGKIII